MTEDELLVLPRESLSPWDWFDPEKEDKIAESGMASLGDRTQELLRLESQLLLLSAALSDVVKLRRISWHHRCIIKASELGIS